MLIVTMRLGDTPKTLGAIPLDVQGNETIFLPGSIPTWSITDPVFTLTPSADGKTCQITPSKIGQGQFQVNGVNDLNQGISGVADGAVAAGAATTVRIIVLP